MFVPKDDSLGIHLQEDRFLEREIWDVANTPEEAFPLLLNFHPLVIYRFQVLKQADVVLAQFLRGSEFTAEEKRADFEYYDPITTGDSSLSAVVLSIIAAEVGYQRAALDYFRTGLFVDLADLHGNTSNGVHIASAGGVWNALVHGFGGMRQEGGRISFDPRLPEAWPELTFPLTVRGSRFRTRLVRDRIEFTLEEGEEIEVSVRGALVAVTAAVSCSRLVLGDHPDFTVDLGAAPTVVWLPLFALCAWIVWMMHRALIVRRTARGDLSDPAPDPRS